MSRTPVVTPEIAEQVRARRRAGVSYATICREFGISKGSVGVALSGELPGGKRSDGGPVAKGRSSKSPPPAPTVIPIEPMPTEPIDKEPADLELVPLLERQVRALEELAHTAQTDANVDAYTKIARVLNTTTALLAKIIPPPAPDPEAAPSMLASAAAARAKIRERLVRLGERS